MPPDAYYEQHGKCVITSIYLESSTYMAIYVDKNNELFNYVSWSSKVTKVNVITT